MQKRKSVSTEKKKKKKKKKDDDDLENICKVRGKKLYY
jgi:hypothetical protein